MITKEPLKILVVGNHTCANRGDSAILRGLAEALEKLLPNCKLTLLSRFPDGSSYLLGRTCLADPLYSGRGALSQDWRKAFMWAFAGRFAPLMLAIQLFCRGISIRSLWPSRYRAFSKLLYEHDLVIQVGGSFFVDLYGATQYEHAMLSILNNKPILLIGHSVGPFRGQIFRAMSKITLRRVDEIVLREELSGRLLKELRVGENKVTVGGDTAWLVDAPACPRPLRLNSHRPLVAITVRNLAPFEERLAISQTAYEVKFAELSENLIDNGFDVLAVSCCTGLDSYANDDRMVAIRIRRRLRRPGRFHVVMEELNDVQLGEYLSCCRCTVGTRLHSTIISMRFGTPALAIYYEHKSQGIFEKLGLKHRSFSINEMNLPHFNNELKEILSRPEVARADVVEIVAREAEITRTALSKAIGKVLNRQESAPAAELRIYSKNGCGCHRTGALRFSKLLRFFRSRARYMLLPRGRVARRVCGR